MGITWDAFAEADIFLNGGLAITTRVIFMFQIQTEICWDVSALKTWSRLMIGNRQGKW